MLRNRSEVVDHLLARGLADARDEVMERLGRFTLREIAARDPVDRLGDALRRYRADRQAIGASVVLPLAAEHDLKMRHGVSILVAAYSIEAEVGDMVLAAGVEAAADLDVQSADGLVHFEALLREAHA